MTWFVNRACIAAALFLATLAQAEAPSRAPPLPVPVKIGTTYNMAQTALALPGGRVAVGRWDGSLQLWQVPEPGALHGPRLRQSQLLPSGEGVQMLASLDGGRLVSGHDEQSLAVWSHQADGLSLRSLVEFDPKFGAATSASQFRVGSDPILVVGHESGFVTLWRIGRWSVSLAGQIDVHSPHPVPSPFPLRHIRAVLPWREEAVITGSEDGDLTMLQLRASEAGLLAAVVARIRYNPSAKRGVNGLALVDNLLAVTSCAVGEREPNLHLLRVEPGRLVPLDAARLKQDEKQAQVFSFSVVGTSHPIGPVFWVSTQEGLVWQLRVESDKLRVVGQVPVASSLGAALVYVKERQLLVAVGHEATVLKVP